MWSRSSRWCVRAAIISPELSSALKSLGFEGTTASVSGSHSSSIPLPTQEDVRQRYRSLARLYHPDVSSGDSQRMQLINASYELIQTSGILQREGGAPEVPSAARRAEEEGTHGAEKMKAASKPRRRHRRPLPDAFAAGDLSWAMSSSLEWKSMVSSANHIREEELSNPSNHPLSVSRFFTLEDDACIYRMIRSGATVPQVARTLGKAATFIEKRLQNAQFKLRVQYLLRQEKQEEGRAQRLQAKKTAEWRARSSSHASTAWGHSAAGNASQRVLRRSPLDGSPVASSSSSRGEGRMKTKLEWEPTVPRWKDQAYFVDLSLEEKARYQGVMPEEPEEGAALHSQPPVGGEGKLGRSYANYQRIYGGGGLRR